MTACTNKARGAVVAALAGVLALGAAPAVALATGTADAQIELQFADPEGAFSNAEIRFNVDGMTYDSTATPRGPPLPRPTTASPSRSTGPGSR